MSDEMMGKSQYGFTKGNLIAFYAETTGWVDEGRAVDVSYLDFSIFDPLSHVFADKLVRYGLGRRTTRWVEN